MTSQKLTLDTCLNDLARWIESDIQRVTRTHGVDIWHIWTEGSGKSRGSLTPQDIEGLGSCPPIWTYMQTLYEFATTAQTAGTEDDILEALQAGIEFFRGVLTVNGESRDLEAIDDSPCIRVLNEALARWSLDEGLDLTLKQMALLARVDVRTIRNAASSKGSDHLKTIKEGGRTLVDNDAAREWLSNRRGFKESRYLGSEQAIPPLSTPAELGAWLRNRRTEKGFDNAEGLAKEIGWPAKRASEIVALEEGKRGCHVEDCAVLADTLELDPGWLTSVVMQVFYPNQYGLLKQQLASTNKQ